MPPEETLAQDLVYALAASPDFARDGTCFAARHSGLYRSDDGGLTWRPAYDSLNLQAPLPTIAVAVSPDFLSDRMVFAGAPGGILYSVDAGRNWQAVLFPSPPPTVAALVVSPDFANDGTLLAGTTEDGIFRSTDRGRHWSASNFGLLDLNVLCLAISPDFARDETAFAGTESGLFRSTNGGRSWREVGAGSCPPLQPTGFAPVLCLVLSPSYAQDGILFAGTEAAGLFRSGDRGESWTRLGEGAITGAVNGLVLSPEFVRRPELLVLSSEGLLVSGDGGDSWSEWTTAGGLPSDLTAVAAPEGLRSGAPLLVGRADGSVLRNPA